MKLYAQRIADAPFGNCAWHRKGYCFLVAEIIDDTFLVEIVNDRKQKHLKEYFKCFSEAEYEAWKVSSVTEGKKYARRIRSGTDIDPHRKAGRVFEVESVNRDVICEVGGRVHAPQCCHMINEAEFKEAIARDPSRGYHVEMTIPAAEGLTNAFNIDNQPHDALRQAQQLATTLVKRLDPNTKFEPCNTLWAVLNQIDHITASMVVRSPGKSKIDVALRTWREHMRYLAIEKDSDHGQLMIAIDEYFTEMPLKPTDYPIAFTDEQRAEIHEVVRKFMRYEHRG